MPKNDGVYNGFIDTKKIRQSASHDIKYEAFNIASRRISLDINFNTIEIVPENFKADLSKENDVSRFAKHFDEFLLKTQNSSYELLSTVNMSIDLLLGMEQPPNASNKKKTRQFFDVYGLMLHLGTFTVNFDLKYMDDMLFVMKHIRDLLVLGNITEFRPFLKPITDKEVLELRKAVGRDFAPAEEEILKRLRFFIVQDYFRLYSYTILFKNYSALEEIDVKRRLIWKFKKASTIYQLVMGKTQMQLADEEQVFLKQEAEYLEKKKAIDLNNRLYYESLLDVEPGESGLDIYIKNISRVNSFLSPYCLMVKVSLNIKVNLMSISEDTGQHSPRKVAEATKALEAEVNNICVTFVKMKGALMFDVGFKLNSMELKFKDPINENSMNFVSETIKKVLIDEVKVYADGLEKVLVPFRLTEVSLSVLCELMRGPNGELSGAVSFETKVNLGKVEVCFSPVLASKLVHLKSLADHEIKILKKHREIELNPKSQMMLMKVVSKVHKYAKLQFFIKCENLQNTTSSNKAVLRLMEKFIPKYRVGPQVVEVIPESPEMIDVAAQPNHQANYLSWRKKRDFKVRQAQKFKDFLKRMDHNLFFKLSRMIGDLVQAVMDAKLLLDLLQIDVKLKLSTFVLSLNDSNNEVREDHQARCRHRYRPRRAFAQARRELPAETRAQLTRLPRVDSEQQL